MAKLGSIEMDKLGYELFTVLESKFLFGGDSSLPPTPVKNPNSSASAAGKVRILSIDGGGEGILAGAALRRLESTLRALSGDQNASIADFFDVAAGSGAGGVLASMLFTRGPDGRPLFSAADALLFLSEDPSPLSKRRFFSRRRSSGLIFKEMFRGHTIRDFIKPVLVTCYDLSTGSPFVFSRADAAEADGYDFEIGDVCRAAARADRTAQVRSVDGKTEVVAVGGGVGMGNPTAAAITHVLHNKMEFPFADGVEDLLVVSLGDGDGGGHGDGGNGMATPSRKEMVKIAGACAADTVDQAVALAFGHKNCAGNYLRIQAYEFFAGRNGSASESSMKRKKPSKLAAAEVILSQRNLESALFRGKKISELSNAEKLDGFAEELIREKHRRKSSPIPTVLIKRATTPRSSSAAVSTAFTSSSSLASSTPPCSTMLIN